MDQSHTDRDVGDPVDEDKPARLAVLTGIERNRLTQLHATHADLIRLEPGRGQMLESVHADLVLHPGNRSRNCLAR